MHDTQVFVMIIFFLSTACTEANDLRDLAALYNSTNGPSWAAVCRWSSSLPTCTSYGVYCNSSSGRVTRLNLSSCNITGSLPSDWSSLTALEVIDLNSNRLTGTLPHEWSNLSALVYLYLYSNQLTGTLPHHWSRMLALQDMHLALNQLTGTLPHQWSNLSALKNLYLHSNQLTGTLPHLWSNLSVLQKMFLYSNLLHGPLPPQWSNLSALQYIHLYSNGLTGTLPHEWSSMSALLQLYLYSNQLTGTLPDEWSSMSALRVMLLNSNNLSGALPHQWSNQSLLQRMQLDNNILNGTLPHQWSSMSALQIMYLYSNQLTGTLPPQWSDLQALQNMYLYSNNLDGSLPSQWFRLSALRHLYLHSNRLTGTLPHQWSNLSMLQKLYLYSNELTGTLPHQWSRMSTLQDMHLSTNQLTGPLPPQWFNLSALRVMYLHSNQLTGTLPHQWSSMSALQLMHLGTNQLTGSLPPQWSNLSALQEIYLHTNSLDGTLPAQWSNMSALQYMYLHSNYLVGPLSPQWSNLSALQVMYLHSNKLTGTLPHQWSSMSALQVMHLGKNQLTGPLPPQWFNLSALRVMYLHSNQLTGTLPHQWSSMSALQVMHLGTNQLTGPLPPQWSNLSALQEIYLHTNSLDGTLPAQWSNMSALQYMYLHSNYLVGPLSPQWSNLSALQVMYLYSNQLTGTLPHQWSSLSALQFMYLRANQLTGTLPYQWSRMSALQFLHLSVNHLDGTLPHQWSNLSALQQMYLYSNQLTGTLPHQWSRMSTLQFLYLYENHLCGTIPALWQSLPAAVRANASLDLQNNSLTLHAAAWYTFAPYVLSVVVRTWKLAVLCISSASHTASMTKPSSSSVSDSFLFGLLSTSNMTSTVSPSAHCDVLLCSIAAPATSSSLPLSSVALQPLEPGASPLMHAAPVPYAVAQSVTTFALRLVCGDYPLPLGVRNAVLLDSGETLVSEPVAADEVLLSLSNRTSGRASWLPANALPFRPGTTIRIGLTISCGGNVAIVVSVPILQEPLSALASTTSAVNGATQWVSAVSGSGAVIALARAAAAQRLHLCSSMSSSHGGLLGLSIGYRDNSGRSVARGAVVGNIGVLLAAVAALFCVAFFYSATTGSDCRSSLLRVALPSSLLPVWVATLPTTATALPLLVDNDAGFLALGAVSVLLPMLLLLAVPLLGCSDGLLIVEHGSRSEEGRESTGTTRLAVVTLLRSAFARRWRWQARTPVPGMPLTLLRGAWVVLLDHRVLWYPALDASVLMATCVLVAASGMGDVHLCRRAGWAMLALCAGQLCVVLVVRPMMSLASNVHSATCLVLTCSALLVQCVGLSTGELLSPAAATAAVALQLAVVGLSLVKLLDDVWNVVRSVLRLLMDVGVIAPARASSSKQEVISAGKEPMTLEHPGFSIRDIELFDCQQSTDDDIPAGVMLPVKGDPLAAEGQPLPSRRLLLFEELALLKDNDDD